MKNDIYLEKSLPFYNKSILYIDTAILISSNKHSEFYNTSDYQDIINYHVFHSLELFLKFSLLSSCKDKNCFNKTFKKFSHNIEGLYDSYKLIFQEEIFDIDHPFNFNVDSNNEEELMLRKKHFSQYPISTLDQYFKYPYDKLGNYTAGAYLIKLENDYLIYFKSEMERVFNIIIQ